jgi:hypothetical protein
MRTLYSPLEFKFGDEFQHWRTADDILLTGRLYNPNPLLEVSPFFPGIENVTTALATITGLSIFNSAWILLFVSRVAFLFAIVSLFDVVGVSQRLTGIASLIYMCNPHYQFINSFFGYQALGVAFMTMVLWAIAKLDTKKTLNSETQRFTIKLVYVVILMSLTITHHLTNYITIVVLALWAVVSIIKKRFFKIPLSACTWAMPLAVALTIIWSAFVATSVFDYFNKPLKTIATKFFSSTIGEENKEAKKQAFVLQQNPPIERVISISSTALLCAGVVVGAIAIYKRQRHNPAALMLALLGLGYPASWIFRVISPDGAEFTGRLSTYVFLGVGYSLASAVLWLEKPNWASAPLRWLKAFQNQIEPVLVRRLLPLTFLGLALIFGGSITMGYPSITWRLPGKFIVNAFERSIEPQGVHAAEWAKQTLGTNNRITSDFINKLLIGSYGRQNAIGGLSWIFFAPTIDDEVIRQIQNFKLQYVLADLRLTRLLPALGVYFDVDEPNANAHFQPMPLMAMQKFDRAHAINRVFDSGDIVIYDVGGLIK